ncbi:protein kinase, putative [Leishmania donovani]|uniref:Protein kinase, putative n=1 Tax=Leishmania donovani TaxID=5661 RepID=E9BCF6_LEIDO|nr:protein kinase, putative [Leishmania donovani]CBZ32932.1 protein kinase, putative [Leishmania donovani]
MDPAGRRLSGEQQQQQQPADRAKADADRGTVDMLPPLRTEASPFEQASAITNRSSAASAPLSVAVKVMPTLAAAMSSLRAGDDNDGGGENEGEEEPFLTNGSIALAEFTSLLKPAENNSILKEHIIHLLRDVDAEETLMRIARALEAQGTNETPVNVSATTCTGSSRDVASYTNASQSTVASMSTMQRRRSSAVSRRDATSLETLAGLSFLHSRRGATSPSAQESPSSAQPSEDVAPYNRSTRGLVGPLDTSFNSRSSLGTREEEQRQSKQQDDPLSAFMAASASQLSDATPTLRESPGLPTGSQCRGRRVAVSAAPCMAPPMIGEDSPATALPPLRVVPKTSAEEQQLRRLLRRCHSFSSLEADTLESVLKAMDKEVHAAGAAILEQGQATTEKLYLVGEGTCEAIKNGKSLGPLQPGGTFGELELMYKQAMCAATVRCVTRCVLYTLDEASYHRAVMTSALQKRRKFEKLTMSVPFLRCLPDFERMKIAEALETRVYQRGKTIIRFGSPGNYMHFIIEGEVKVVGRNSGRRVEVVRLRDGDVVGELEFLFNHLTVADVVATSREVRTACISREHFELIIGPIQDRLKEFVATSSTYEKYYVAEVADESVRTELNRIESSRKHRRVASRDQRTAIGDIDPHGEVLLSAPLPLLHGKCDTAGKAGGVSGVVANSDSAAGNGANAQGQRRAAARGSAELPKAMLRFPFAPITGKDVAVLALREDGLIMYWNSVLERLTSYSAGEAVGQNIYSFLLSEREQQCMYKAVNAARNYAGEAEAFLKRPSTKSIQFTLARSDGLTKTTVRLTIVPPVVSAGGNAAEVVLGFGEEVKEGPQKMLEQPQWLSGQIRAILADGTQTFEERLECIAETLNNFESTYRAMTVSTERLRVVNIRQMMGHILMDFGSECVSRGISVRQRFEGLPSERAYLDANLLPECLRYAMKLCLKYSDPGGSIITIMITVTEKNGLEFLVINFNLTGDGMPKAIAQFFDSPLKKHGDSVTTMSVDDDSGDGSGDDSDNDAEASMALRSTLQPRLRRKLRRVQRAVEDQGGTLRMLRNPQDSNIAFLIPFMPASEQDAENASIEESLSTLADSAGAGQLASLAGMSSGVGPPTSVAAAAAAFSVSLVNTPAGESSGLSNMSVAGTVATVSGQPNFSYTTCLAEDTPTHRIMLSSFLWERHHAVLTAFTFEDIVGLVGVADILIIDLQQSAITFLHERDPITRLREMLRHMAVIITSTNFDLVSSDTYAAAGFITLKKPCTPVQAMKAIRRAEEKSAVVKLERLRIEQTRETLARNSRGAWRHGALLGKGSSGEVYEAYDVLTGGKMAVKEMRLGNNDAKIEQFVQEISTMCNLQHPNIIHYFYCEESKEQKVIRVFMEFAGGGTLQSLLKTKGRLEYAELRALLRDVVEGLAYIHSQHYVHGDIKTANVLLSNDGKGKIGDFGTARTVNEGELLYVMQGSPLYMSPECMSAGEEDEDGNKIGYSFPSDIWSLGCVAMEMATNKPPFAHIKTIKGPAGLTTFITSLTDVPDLSPLFKCHPSIVEFVSACLNPDPSQRATAQDLLQMSLFSDSTHSDRNSAVMALKRAQLLHVLNKFVAFQEPEEAEKLEKRRNRLKVSRLASDFFSSRSSSSDNASEPMSTVFLNAAPAAEVEEATREKRRPGAAVTTAAAATAAVAAGNEDESDKDVTRRSGTVALAAGGASESPDGARPAGASAGAPLVNTVTSTDGSLNQAASTFTRYLRKWDFSTSSSSSSSQLSANSKAMTAAGGEGAHRDPVTGVAGGNDEAEPDARNPQTEGAYDLSPTPKKRSKTRSRPRATLTPPMRKPSHQRCCPDSTTTTTNSAEKDFFATSSDNSSSSSSGRALNEADARSEAPAHQGGTARLTGTATTARKGPRPTGSEAVGYTPSFPGRRRNVRLDEAGNIVPFDRLSSMMSVAALLNNKGEQHGDDASAEGSPGVAAAAATEATAASRAPFPALGDANDHVLSPSSAAGLANASFTQPPGNYSFFGFNRNISFMGTNMDEVLNSAANDFLSNLAANWHTSNAACVETASSAGSMVQLPSRTFLRAEGSGSGRSHATLSSNREGECRTDRVVGVASPLAVTGQSEDRGDVPKTPSRRRGGAISRSPSARSPLEARGPGEPASIEGGNSGVQHGGTTLPLPQSPPPKPLSTGAAPTAASRSTHPVLSQLGSASYTSDDGTTSMTPRGDSVPLVGAAASSHRQRRARPPITNQSFFVVEDGSSAPLFSPHTGVTKSTGSMAGGPVSASRVSLATWSSVASADGSVTGGVAGETSSSTLLQQNYANVAVVAPAPVFPTFSTSNARAVWQQRRRHVAGGGRGGVGGGNMSNIHLTAPPSNEGSVYLMVADEQQGDGQRWRAAGASVSREGNDGDDDDLTSAAFGSMRSGFSRRSSAQSTSNLTAETLSATHEPVSERRPARSGDAAASASEGRRGAEVGDALPFSNLASEADSMVFTYLQRIDASLQDVLSQLQVRRRQCRRKSGGSITGVQDGFDHAPSSTPITTVQATPPQSATQLTTLQSSLSSALPSPASANSTSEVATTVTVSPQHHRSTGVSTSPAKLPRPLSSCTTPVTISQSRQGKPNPLSMRASPPLSKQCSNPRWPTEDEAEAEGDPVNHDATVWFDTPLSPSSSGHRASSGCDDVNVEVLLRKMLWRVSLLLDEVSSFSPRGPATASVARPP